MGSPPPTRGTLKSTIRNIMPIRITPAYAGNTCFSCFFSFRSWDHPRLRGEHITFYCDTETVQGSPPPTRGTLVISTCEHFKLRITPAYAGNTAAVGLCHRCHRDHPRLRGEHSAKCLQASSTLGSPPPTRGTHPTPIFSRSYLGITPAYAGNTYCLSLLYIRLQDHPRLRGEHY